MGGRDAERKKGSMLTQDAINEFYMARAESDWRKEELFDRGGKGWSVIDLSHEPLAGSWDFSLKHTHAHSQKHNLCQEDDGRSQNGVAVCTQRSTEADEVLEFEVKVSVDTDGNLRMTEHSQRIYHLKANVCLDPSLWCFPCQLCAEVTGHPVIGSYEIFFVLGYYKFAASSMFSLY